MTKIKTTAFFFCLSNDRTVAQLVAFAHGPKSWWFDPSSHQFILMSLGKTLDPLYFQCPNTYM